LSKQLHKVAKQLRLRAKQASRSKDFKEKRENPAVLHDVMTSSSSRDPFPIPIYSVTQAQCTYEQFYCPYEQFYCQALLQKFNGNFLPAAFKAISCRSTKMEAVSTKKTKRQENTTCLLAFIPLFLRSFSRYIFPTIAFPNSGHFTSLAPSISRAKSYVTILC
jgi:hypothetical protein